MVILHSAAVATASKSFLGVRTVVMSSYPTGSALVVTGIVGATSNSMKRRSTPPGEKDT